MQYMIPSLDFTCRRVSLILTLLLRVISVMPFVRVIPRSLLIPRIMSWSVLVNLTERLALLCLALLVLFVMPPILRKENKSMSFFTKYNRPKGGGLTFKAASLVQPQYKESADINIMLRRALGGDMSVFVHAGKYLDVADAPDSFHEVLNIAKRAEMAWDSMPDSLRRTFGNSAAFLAWLDSRESAESTPVAPATDENKEGVTPSGAEASMPKSVPNT